MTYPRISVVTPSFNQAAYLEHTIRSIVEQGYPNLEYIIIDGGSTDGSVDIIRKYEKHLAYWVSEPDKGLYDALQKGFDKTTGDIMGWLNSDDMLHRLSLFTLADIFSSVPKVNWIQGIQTVYDELGRTTLVTHPTFKSKYNYLLKDYKKGSYTFIQQESTYWRRCLWDTAGGYISRDYKLAGDFELWMRFFRHDNLYYTNALIGGFRVRKSNQLSIDSYDLYLAEADAVIDRMQLSRMDKRILSRITLFRKYILKMPVIRGLGFLRKKYKSYFCVTPTVQFDTQRQTYYLRHA